jgi:hypothetical protein
LTPILSGLCILAGRALDIGDILAVRAGWGIMSGLTGGLIFLLGRQLYRNAMAGVLGAMAFTGFWTFGREAVSGPRAKSPFVLFEVAFFYFAACRRWGWAGAAAALATWVWQPGIVFVFAALVLPLLFGGEERDERIKGFGYAATGVIAPTLALFGFFILKGALIPLIDGSVVFNLTHLDRPPFDLVVRVIEPLQALYNGYTMMAVPAVLGMLYLLLHLHAIFHHPVRRLGEWPMWAPLAFTLPFVFLWTFLDFQGAADLYPFLPYMAVGMGGLIWRLCQGICTLQAVPGLLPHRVGAIIAAVLVMASTLQYHTKSEDGLKAQRVSAAQVAERFSGEGEIAVIGLPELMVLTGRRNVNRYGFVIAGIDRKIMKEWPGGIAGFIRDFPANGVEAIGVGPTEGDHRDLLFKNLQLHYKKERFGYFDVYVRTKVPDKPSDSLQN